jgi:hypothetical protein
MRGTRVSRFTLQHYDLKKKIYLQSVAAKDDNEPMTTRTQATSSAVCAAKCLILCAILSGGAAAADWARPDAKPAGVSTLAAMDLPAKTEAKPAAPMSTVTTHIVLPAITANRSREINITPAISNSPADSYADCMPGAFRQIR